MNWDGECDDEPAYDDSETILCRECRREVYEDAPSCPYCGHYMKGDSNWLAERPIWFQALWLIVVGVLIVQLISWCF